MVKEIFFTLIAIIFSLGAFCQATQQGVGSIEFPEPTSKITKDKALEHIKQKFDGNNTLTKDFPTRKGEHLYIIKDVLVDINFTKVNPPKQVDLNQRKTAMDNVFDKDKNYYSEIRNINGNNVFVMSTTVSESVENFIFFVFKADGTKAISGKLDFQHKNKEEAKKILEHILKHAKFKD